MKTETAALIVSAVSLLVAGLSLGWQVAQWLLSAARPKAKLMHGVVDGSGAYVGPVGRSGARLNVQQLRPQGIAGPEVIGIQVTNHGRAPLVVERVTVHTRGGQMTFMPVGDLIGPTLPQTIEPGANQSWYTDLDRANALASSSREVLKEQVTGVYMTALLGTGKTIKTPRSLSA